MSLIRHPGYHIVHNPFYTDIGYDKRYIVYTRAMEYSEGFEEKGYNVYQNSTSLHNDTTDIFISKNPYPSYRIKEFDVLLTIVPSVFYNRGMVWSYYGYYMFVNYRQELIITKGCEPGAWLDPNDTFQEYEYWVLTQAWAGTLSEDSFTGRHFKDKEKDITVVKEFPRWIRRHDGSGTNHRDNMPCGYYDPVDGAEGTLLIGTPIETGNYIKYDGKVSAVRCYMGELLT